MIRSNFIGDNDIAFKKSWICFLFSLKNKDHLPPFKAEVYQHSDVAIVAAQGYGPIFGSGNDLHISNNAHSSSLSYANLGWTYKPPTNYTYGTPKCKALLAGTYQFNATEVEVYYRP